MKMPKPSEDDKAVFRDLVPEDSRVTVKPMFGNLAAFVNGNMFMGLFGRDIGVKLNEADGLELLAHEGAGPFGPEERPLGGYVTLPASWLGTPKAVAWAERALEYVGGLPPKAPKGKKAR